MKMHSFLVLTLGFLCARLSGSGEVETFEEDK